jgi:hypothetical protein
MRVDRVRIVDMAAGVSVSFRHGTRRRDARQMLIRNEGARSLYASDFSDRPLDRSFPDGPLLGLSYYPNG